MRIMRRWTVDAADVTGHNVPAREPMNTDEQKLVARCLAGKKSAHEALHRLHAWRVTAYFRRSGFSTDQSDDLTQETFLRAFKSLGNFNSQRGRVRYWVGAIARNVARKYWSRPEGPIDFDPELAEEMFTAPGDAMESPEMREEIDSVRQCISTLPEELARVVQLRYVAAGTTRGIATAVGLPEATVRLRLKEAMGLLERCLKSKGVLE